MDELHTIMIENIPEQTPTKPLSDVLRVKWLMKFWANHNDFVELSVPHPCKRNASRSGQILVNARLAKGLGDIAKIRFERGNPGEVDSAHRIEQSGLGRAIKLQQAVGQLGLPIDANL